MPDVDAASMFDEFYEPPGTTVVGIQRDRWGRPLIDGKPYTRVSTLAGMSRSDATCAPR